MRRFFLAPKKYVRIEGQENTYNFTLKNFVGIFHSPGFKLNRCVLLLEEFLLQHKVAVILIQQSAISKGNDTSILTWRSDGRVQQWDSLVGEMAALPDKMANKLKSENRYKLQGVHGQGKSS